MPFGELAVVQNMSRDWVIDKFSITVGCNTDVEKARKLIRELRLELSTDPAFAPIVIETLSMQGIQKFRDYDIELRLKMMTKAGEQFPLRRMAFGRLKELFTENLIEVPLPTVHVQGAGSAAEAGAAQKLVMDKAAKSAATCAGETALASSGRLAALVLAVLVDDNGGHDDDALDDLLVIGTHLQEGEAGRHHAQDDGADEGAGNPTNAAGERCAADHGGGNGIKLVGHTHAGLTGLGARRRHDAG